VQVSDNVEVERIESTRQSGSEFSVGTHQVTYTVTDKAGLQSSCTFTVSVERLAGLLLITHIYTVYTAEILVSLLHISEVYNCRNDVKRLPWLPEDTLLVP